MVKLKMKQECFILSTEFPLYEPIEQEHFSSHEEYLIASIKRTYEELGLPKTELTGCRSSTRTSTISPVVISLDYWERRNWWINSVSNETLEYIEKQKPCIDIVFYLNEDGSYFTQEDYKNGIPKNSKPL